MELVACAFRKAPSVLKGKYTFYGPIQVTFFSGKASHTEPRTKVNHILHLKHKADFLNRVA